MQGRPGGAAPSGMTTQQQQAQQQRQLAAAVAHIQQQYQGGLKGGAEGGEEGPQRLRGGAAAAHSDDDVRTPLAVLSHPSPSEHEQSSHGQNVAANYLTTLFFILLSASVVVRRPRLLPRSRHFKFQ
jgi:hypothetical protein